MNKSELPPFVCDDLHFDGREIDGYNKRFNFIACCRDAGKSTFLWKKVYNAFRNEGRPSIIIRRRTADITPQYIEDTAGILEKFTGKYFDLEYTKQDIKQGMVDVGIGGDLFCRVISLSAPMMRLKSMMIKNTKYMMTDEFIVNVRIGEKYLEDEAMRFKELFTTYNREPKDIKCYWFGNPYSLYNPYFGWLNVPTNKLYPGSLFAGDKYVVQCYQLKPELQAKLLKENPLYEFDAEYKDYAFDGRAIQDANIRIIENQPRGFGLDFVFKLHGKYLGVYHGFNQELELFYWTQLIDPKEISLRRDIVVFDFGEMVNRSVLNSSINGKKKYYFLKQAIERRQIAFSNISASYMMEEIYQQL